MTKRQIMTSSKTVAAEIYMKKRQESNFEAMDAQSVKSHKMALNCRQTSHDATAIS